MVHTSLLYLSYTAVTDSCSTGVTSVLCVQSTEIKLVDAPCTIEYIPYSSITTTNYGNGHSLTLTTLDIHYTRRQYTGAQQNPERLLITFPTLDTATFVQIDRMHAFIAPLAQSHAAIHAARSDALHVQV